MSASNRGQFRMFCSPSWDTVITMVIVHDGQLSMDTVSHEYIDSDYGYITL